MFPFISIQQALHVQVPEISILRTGQLCDRVRGLPCRIVFRENY